MKNLFDTFQCVQEKHPEIFFNTEAVPATDLVLREAGGKYDIIITHEQLLNNIYPVKKHVIGQLEYALYVSENHPHLDEILKGNVKSAFNFYAPGNIARSYSSDIDFIQQVYGFVPKRIILMPNLDSILLATSNANGVAFIDTGIYVPTEFNLRIIPSGIKFNEVMVWSALSKNTVIDSIGREILDTLQLFQDKSEA